MQSNSLRNVGDTDASTRRSGSRAGGRGGLIMDGCERNEREAARPSWDGRVLLCLEALPRVQQIIGMAVATSQAARRQKKWRFSPKSSLPQRWPQRPVV